MSKRKGIIAILLGVLCAFVMCACGVLGMDGAGRMAAEKAAKDAAESGNIEVEQEEKAAYATGGQLSYPLAALNAATVLYDGTGNNTTAVTKTLTLNPAYVYLFECWGAQGGNGGGQGGYSKGYYQPSSSVTAYAYVGGQGTAGYGGYNGGGGIVSNSTSDWGGGGASDIRIGGTALGNRVIVAGGGGAGKQSAGGAGGGESGAAGGNPGTYSYTPGGGGTQSAGGERGLPTSFSGVTAGSLGQGGIGNGTSGGGGGGGYYGGGGGVHWAGGGGSGYVGGVKWQNGTANGSAVSFSSTAMMQQGGRTGQGRVRITQFNTITIKSVQTATVSQGATRKTGTVSLVNTSIATEYNNSSWGLAFAGTDVNTPLIYYLNGSTYTNAAGRYVESVSVTRSATTAYSQTLNFKPRVYMNNQTLYVRMYSNQYKFYIYLPFKVTTDTPTLSQQSQTIERSGLTLKVGNSAVSSVDLSTDPNGWGIYNPSGTGKQTMFVTMPIGINSSLTVNATDFYTCNNASADGVYIMSANKNGNDADFDTTLNKSNDITSFTVNGSITIKPKSTDNTGYMRLTLTLRHYEKTANYSGVSLPSGATLESSGYIKWAEKEVDVVFRLDNTRAVPMSATVAGSKTDARVVVESGKTARIYVNEFAYDPDRNVNRIATGANDIKVPTYHFLPVKKDGKTIVELAGSSPYKDTLTGVVDKNDTAKTGTYYTGEGTAPTGWSKDWITTNEAHGTAYVSYVIRTDASNGLDYIEFTGIRATDNKWGGNELGDFYVLVRIIDAGEDDDPGIWLPIAIRVTDGASTPATTPVMTFNAGDNKVFTPWGVSYTVTGKAQTTNGIGLAAGTLPTLNTLGWNNEESEYYKLAYLATDRDNYVYTGAFEDIMELAQNDPVFIDHKDQNNINLWTDTSKTNSDFSKFFTVELVPVYMRKSLFTNLTNYDALVQNGYIKEYANSSDVVSVNGLKVTAKKSTQNMYIEFDVKMVSSRVRKDYGAGSEAYSHSVTTSLRCRVDGTTPTVLDTADLGSTIKQTANATVSSIPNNKNASTVTVSVKNGQTLKISPYDLVTDGDLPEEITRDNCNPDGNGFAEMQTAVNKAYKVKFASAPSGDLVTSGTMVTEGMRMDRLRFGTLGYVQNDKYASITRTADDGIDPNASRDVDLLIITGKEKPNSQSVYASTTIKVYDAQGNTVEIVINVKVINSAPRLSAAAIERDYFRLSASGTANSTNDEELPSRDTLDSDANTNQFYDNPTAAGNGDHNVQAASSEYVYYNVREYTVRELVFDVDTTDRERGLISIVDNFASEPYNYTRILNSATGEYEFVPLNNQYIKAEIANGSGNRSNERVLKVTGLSSTQGLTGGLWLRFTVTDDSDPATLYLQFEVMNSDPVVNSEGLTESARNDETVYTWAFEESDKRTSGKSKYIVSDEDTGKHFTSNAKLYKVIASDPDSNQKVVPVAAAANFTNGIPTVIDKESEGNGNGVLTQGAKPTKSSAAVWLTYGGDGSAPANYSSSNVKLRYYDDSFNEVTFASNATWKDTLAYHWAIEVTDTIISSTNENVQLHISLTSSNRDVTATKTTKVPSEDGSAEVDKVDTLSAGTEGGYGARTEARVRGNGTTVTDGNGNAVTNNVSKTIEVNLDIAKVPQGLINNFEINAGLPEANTDGKGNATYYTEYIEDESADADYLVDNPKNFVYQPINVGNTGWVAVPLSYFARLFENSRYPQEMLNTVNYATKVAVETRENFTQAFSAMTIFDDHGNSWTGAELNNNPYVNIEWAEPSDIIESSKGTQKYINYGKNVYDPTINRYGIVESAAMSAESTLYTEDTRGIKLTKKYQRSNDDVYIKIDLCKWTVDDANQVSIPRENQSWRAENERVDSLTIPKDTGVFTNFIAGTPITTVTAKINIANAPMSLTVDSYNTKSGVHSDGSAKIRTSVGATNSAIFLSNVGVKGDNEGLSSIYTANNVVYNVDDDDNVNIKGRLFDTANKYPAQHDLYRDKALFLENSIEGAFLKAGNEEQKKYILENASTGTNSAALKKYLGIESGGAIEVSDSFNPNPNYKNYFTLGATSGDTGLLTIRAVRKTALDVTILKNADYRSDLQDLATAKGLGTLKDIPAASDPNYATILDTYARIFDLRYDGDPKNGGFYYPFKLIAYDDYNGSGFLKSSPTAVEIKIYIDNTAPSVNTMVTDQNARDTISFSLSVTDSPNRSFDIATLINDMNMLANDGSGNYYLSEQQLKAKYADYKAGKTDADGKPISSFTMLDLLTTDYIGSISVDNGQGASIDEEKDANAWASSSRAVSYWIERENGAFLRINFHANKRVSETSTFVLRFADNHNNVVANGSSGTKSLTFSVTVANNRPIADPAAPKAITMSTGDTFTLLATNPDSFDPAIYPDVVNSRSYTNWNNKDESFRSGYRKLYAEENRFNAEANKDGANKGSGNLGSIVVFDDDTPWALRFDSSQISVSPRILYYESNDSSNYFLYRDDADRDAPLAYTFRATTPGVTTLRVRAFDESTSSYRDHEITVTVVSTAPIAIHNASPAKDKIPEDKFKLPDNVSMLDADVSNSVFRYSYTMRTGESKEFRLTDFAYDVDDGDNAKMRLMPIQGSTYFFYNASTDPNDILKPSTAANIKQLISISDRGDARFTVNAENFSTEVDPNGAITAIEFRIADGSGATDNKGETAYLRIQLQISVVPSDISATAKKDFTVKSVLDYLTDEDAAPTSINLVSRPDGANRNVSVFLDNDLAAKSTSYTVKLYSMLTKVGENDYKAAKVEDIKENPNAYLAYDSSASGKADDLNYKTGDNIDYLWDYIDPKGIKFNATTGVIEFVPKKSTIVRDGKVSSYDIYVEISKPFYDKDALKLSSKDQSSTFSLAVDNSAPTATPEVADNMNSDRTSFLRFNAYRGDEREYVVFDPAETLKSRKTLFEDNDTDDTLTVRSVEVKSIGGQAQVYKTISERDPDTGNYVTRNEYYGVGVLNDDGSGRGSAVTYDTRNNRVKFTVNRRITTDKYNDLPTYIVYTVTVADSANNIAQTDVTVVVNNSLPGFKLPDEDNPLPDNVTMSFDGLDYSMVIRLENDAPETTLKLNTFYTDKDFVPRSPSTDRVVFSRMDDPRYKYYDAVGSGAATTFGNDDFDNLFSVNAMRDNESLVFRALSYERGQSVNTKLIISDGTGAPEVVIDIKLIIDNTAPTFNSEVADQLYIMGNNTPKSEYDDALDPVEYNLYDFITDPNKNDLNPENADRVQIGAQGGASSIVLSQRVREVTKDGEVVNENLVYVLPSVDTFTISPRAGYYGYQQVTINVRDGAVDGDDTKYAQFTLMIWVTRNPGDVPVRNLELAYNKLTPITPDKLFTDEEGKNQGVGFVVKTIEKAGSSGSVIEITSQDNSSSEIKNASEPSASKTWYIRALNENATTPVRVEIAILGREDGDTVWKDFNIINIPNQQPYFTDRYAVQGNVLFSSTEMVNNTVTIKAYDYLNRDGLFDDYEKDELTLTSVKSKKSIVVDAAIDTVNQSILLNFKGRGTSLITVKLKDESQREYTYSFVAENVRHG